MVTDIEFEPADMRYIQAEHAQVCNVLAVCQSDRESRTLCRNPMELAKVRFDVCERQGLALSTSQHNPACKENVPNCLGKDYYLPPTVM